MRVKDSDLQARFHRLRARRGAKKAILVVAASMLTAAYPMLKNGVECRATSVPITSPGATALKRSYDSFVDSTISAVRFN